VVAGLRAAMSEAHVFHEAGVDIEGETLQQRGPGAGSLRSGRCGRAVSGRDATMSGKREPCSPHLPGRQPNSRRPYSSAARIAQTVTVILFSGAR